MKYETTKKLAIRAALGACVIALVSIGMASLMGAGAESTAALDAKANGALRYVPNTAFGYGEKLVYNVNYKFVTAGQAVMRIGPEPRTVGGRECYDATFSVRTTSAFDKVFKVRDFYRSMIDVQGVMPWRFEQKVREGDYSRDFSANIDQKTHTARTTEGTFTVPEFVHDILSAFYYTRTQDIGSMRKGQSFMLKNFYGKETHDLRIRVLGRERVKVAAGTFDCVVVEPMVAEGGLFKNEGRIVVYMTDDDRKIPVKVSTKVLIGTIDGELVSYSGIRGPIKAKRQ